MSSEELGYLIGELEDTKAAIESHAKNYFLYRQAGNVRYCKALAQSFTEAHGYLVRNFGITTAAEIDELLSNLKNGNVYAHPNSGVLLEKNPTDHLESVLTAFGHP